VLRNKSDAADARAIWTAAQQPEARFVAIKSEAQQSILALHRIRAQLMKVRIMQTNALRSILYEFGEILSEGYQPFAKEIALALAPDIRTSASHVGRQFARAVGSHTGAQRRYCGAGAPPLASAQEQPGMPAHR